ncbi:MAG: GNAT family N-acetyltransferase [Coriobacteriales bacterium]|nr:GNAT family N-acetyltransferase [Coriobacteriales bacterium]
MRVTLATPADLDSIMELYFEAADAMEGTPHDCCWRRDGHPSPEFVGGLVATGSMLIAMEGDELIGAVGIDHDLGHDYGELAWLTCADDEQVAVLHLLVVKKAWRGRGLSRELLHVSLNEARARGMLTARLDATANNAPAIALYESEGFVIVGADSIDVGMPDKPTVPFVVMERLL